MKTKAFILGLIMTSAATLVAAGNTPPNQSNFERAFTESFTTDINSLASDIMAYETAEENMALESWMIEISNKTWSHTSSEEEVELESWMLNLDNSSWDRGNIETELSVESWMCDPSSWLEIN
jgi:hypothetical protein